MASMAPTNQRSSSHQARSLSHFLRSLPNNADYFQKVLDVGIPTKWRQFLLASPPFWRLLTDPSDQGGIFIGILDGPKDMDGLTD